MRRLFSKSAQIGEPRVQLVEWWASVKGTVEKMSSECSVKVMSVAGQSACETWHARETVNLGERMHRKNTARRTCKKLEPHEREKIARVNACEVCVLFTRQREKTPPQQARCGQHLVSLCFVPWPCSPLHHGSKIRVANAGFRRCTIWQGKMFLNKGATKVYQHCG